MKSIISIFLVFLSVTSVFYAIHRKTITEIEFNNETTILQLKEKHNEIVKHMEFDRLFMIQYDINVNKEMLINSIVYLNNKVDPILQEKLVDILIKECVDIPPLLVICLIHQESNFNPLAENKFGTIGLMQIIPKYHQNKIDEMGIETYELFYVENNIKLGVMILKEYFDSKKNIVEALQKYVGASVKTKADKYIENIINNYISLQITHGGVKDSIEDGENM